MWYLANASANPEDRILAKALTNTASTVFFQLYLISKTG